jgi:HK97 family phage major capsid protein/HK97 family phage prohead protease
MSKSNAVVIDDPQILSRTTGVQRAYSVLHVKEITEDQDFYTVTGIATTPTVDRMRDIVDPLGATFAEEIPLLWQHSADKPVGTTRLGKPTKKGIPFSAKIPNVREAGVLRERIQEAIQSIKYRLVAAVSIGFNVLNKAYELLEDGGLRYLETEILELSLVTIPAQPDAVITGIKSIDTQLLAASGTRDRRVVHLAGFSAKANGREATSMNIPEQISSFESKRAASVARINAISEKAAADGRGKDGAEKEEFDNLSLEIETIDAELKDLRSLEKINVLNAKPIVQQKGSNGDGAMELRDPRSVVVLEKKLPPGIGFARLVGCIAAGKGDIYRSMQFAKQRFADDTKLQQVMDLYSRMTGPEIVARSAMITRAPIDVGTTTDTDFALPLVYATQLANEFIEFLRPATIIGRMPGLRRVPFNTRIPRQTGGGTAQWVGEGAPKPLTQQAFDSVSLGYMKLAVITVITEELARFSSPSAEMLIRDDLAKAVIHQMDWDFVDPDNAGVANVKPASISNGVTPLTTAGNSEANIRSDLGALLSAYATNNLGIKGLVLVMPTVTALRLSMMVNTLGQRSFPNISIEGGNLEGIPVITSENPGLTDSSANGRLVLAVNTNDILLADDGQVTIDVSREASVQMDSAPTNPPVAATVLQSFWQQNLIGIKAERFITWAKARSTAVVWTASVNWGE